MKKQLEEMFELYWTWWLNALKLRVGLVCDDKKKPYRRSLEVEFPTILSFQKKEDHKHIKQLAVANKS